MFMYGFSFSIQHPKREGRILQVLLALTWTCSAQSSVDKRAYVMKQIHKDIIPMPRRHFELRNLKYIFTVKGF